MDGDIVCRGCEFYALCDQQDIFCIRISPQKKPYAVKSFILPVKSGHVFLSENMELVSASLPMVHVTDNYRL